MNPETPQITTSCYASNSSGPISPIDWEKFRGVGKLGNDYFKQFQQQQDQPQQPDNTMPNDKTIRRIIQVFIADPNENVPLNRSVLYTGEQKLTDLNDAELFFEVPIKELLDKHNAFRVTCPDREASKRAGKDILLDPVKIRDLRMVVVTVAQF